MISNSTQKHINNFCIGLESELNSGNFIPVGLSCFPFGSCVETTHMLGLYLIEHGCQDVVCARNMTKKLDGQGHCHYWLLVEGMIVDLTIDQFSSYPNYNLVEPDTCVFPSDSRFHSLFEQERLETPSLNCISSGDLRQFYKRLRRNLP